MLENGVNNVTGKLTVGHLELFVRDALKARKFYCEVLGAELVAIQKDRFVWVKLGTLEILLRPRPHASSRPRAASFLDADSNVTLYSSHVDEVAGRLRSNGVTVSAPEDDPGALVFEDGDGNWFQLVDPREH